MPCYGLLGLTICIPSVDDIVNAVITPITNFVTSALSGLVSTLTPLFNTVKNAITPLFQTVIDAITGFLANPLGALTNVLGSVWGVISGLWNNITGALNGLWSSISSSLTSIGTQIWSGITGLWDYTIKGLGDLGASLWNGIQFVGNVVSSGVSQLATAFDGAVGTIGGWVGDALSGVSEALGKGLMSLVDWIISGLDWIAKGIMSVVKTVQDAVVGTVRGLVSGFIETLTVTFSPHSPEKETAEQMDKMIKNMQEQVLAKIKEIKSSPIDLTSTVGAALGIASMLGVGIISIKALAAAADAAHPTKDIGFKDIATGMIAATGAGLMMSTILKLPVDIGLITPLTRAYNSMFTPNLPPYADLISIYVKEGYMEDHWVELPAEMVGYFKELGYSEEWTKRLWGKHWEYPGPSQLYEMLHRTAGNFPEIGVTSDVLRNMLKLHDFEPKWRMPLEVISWNTWRIYDIRTGWEMDLVNDEGLVKRLIDTGYEPKDAELLANIQKMFVLRSEIDGLLTESDTDFMSGWISEDQLKADYGATPYNPSIIEMRISKAKLRQERTDKADLKAALINRYVKGDLSETEFSQELSRLGIQQNRIAIEVTKANATKLKTVKEETTVTSKALTESTYSRSYRLGLIPEAEYRSKLAALKYSPEDIDLLVELNTPEKPAPEEMPTLTLGELKAAFRVGVLTENELAAELDFRHYSPEDISVIIETEKAKIKPKVGEAS